MDIVQLSLLTLLLGLLITLSVSFFQTSSFGKIGVKSKHQKPTFFILGPNNAGKTSFFYNLTNKGDFVATVSSIEPNFSDVLLPISNPSIGKSFQVIDFPGHLKYSQLLKKLMVDEVTLAKIKGIVYVIDSSNMDLVEIAKNLFNLLIITERIPNGVDFLFAVNKNDLFNSRPVFKVQEILESEITKLIKQTLSEKSSQIESGIDNDEDDSSDSNLNEQVNAREFWSAIVSSNQNFKFEMLEGNMDFFGGSVLKNKVEPWENWLDERVVN